MMGYGYCSPGCDCAVFPVRNRGEISRSAHAGALQCAMSPQGGQGWRKGGDHHVKRRFLQSTKIYNFFRRVIEPIIPRAQSAVNGNSGVFNDGGTSRRVAETVLVFPALTRMLVE
jgi:hypothetical protein